MALPQQPRDVLGLVSSHLDGRGLAGFQSLNSSLRADTAVITTTRLRKQKEIWTLILQDLQTGVELDNYARNEGLLQELGAVTPELTEEERVAWIRAVNSLHSPPPLLSNEQELELLKKHLPIYSALMGNAEVYPEYDHQKIVYAYAGYVDPKGEPGQTVQENGVEMRDISLNYDNLTALALVESSFLPVLQIFAQDGARDYSCRNRSIAEVAILRLLYPKVEVEDLEGEGNLLQISPAGMKKDDPRNVLLAVLMIRAVGVDLRFSRAPGILYPYRKGEKYLLSHPVLVRSLLLAGCNLTRERLSYTGEEEDVENGGSDLLGVISKDHVGSMEETSYLQILSTFSDLHLHRELQMGKPLRNLITSVGAGKPIATPRVLQYLKGRVRQMNPRAQTDLRLGLYVT